MDMTQDAQNALNTLYSTLQLGSNKNDDTLYLQALKENQKIAEKYEKYPPNFCGKDANQSIE